MFSCLYPLPQGAFAGMSPTFEACLRRGRLIGFVHVCVHVGTINAHYRRANIIATDVAVRGRATSGLTGTA
jgi:hypothetical protein